MDILSPFLSLCNVLSQLGLSGFLFSKDVVLQWLGRIRGTSLFLTSSASILPILYQHFHRNARSGGQASQQGTLKDKLHLVVSLMS